MRWRESSGRQRRGYVKVASGEEGGGKNMPHPCDTTEEFSPAPRHLRHVPASRVARKPCHRARERKKKSKEACGGGRCPSPPLPLSARLAEEGKDPRLGADSVLCWLFDVNMRLCVCGKRDAFQGPAATSTLVFTQGDDPHISTREKSTPRKTGERVRGATRWAGGSRATCTTPRGQRRTEKGSKKKNKAATRSEHVGVATHQRQTRNANPSS